MDIVRAPRSRFPGRLRGTRSRARAAAVVAAATIAAVVAPSGAASAAARQEAPGCAGVVVSASIESEVVPGGSWSVSDTCVEPFAVYEVDVLGYRLVGGLGAAVYDDGHRGRVAFATVSIAPDRSLSLVGLEDVDAGTVVWAYADGGSGRDGDVRTAGGPATAASVVAPPGSGAGPQVSEPVPASLSLSLVGSGTDLSTAVGPIADELRGVIDEAVAALTD